MWSRILPFRTYGGDDSSYNLSNMVCDGESLLIGVNLMQALRQIRHDTDAVALWMLYAHNSIDPESTTVES
jgi:hypothetical protein